jgi:hypothetical protein
MWAHLAKIALPEQALIPGQVDPDPRVDLKSHDGSSPISVRSPTDFGRPRASCNDTSYGSETITAPLTSSEKQVSTHMSFNLMHRHRIEPDAALHDTWRLPRDHVINRASDQTRTDRGFYEYRELTRDGVMLAPGHLVFRAEW